jgi:hypothetical protein
MNLFFRLGVVLSLAAVATGLFSWFQLLGHDFVLYFVRLSIGAAHFWQNGFDVPHFTPYISGGIPSFADPQSVYYSLPQFLTFFFQPIFAVQATYGIFYVLGYYGFWKLLRVSFQLLPEASHLGALLFVLNGFAFNHLLVGHLTHHVYLLFPWLIYFLLQDHSWGSARAFQQAISFVAILLYALYSGGAHVLILYLITFLIFSPYLIARKRKTIGFAAYAKFLLLSLLLFLACGSGKIVAVLRFKESFHFYPVQAVPGNFVRFLLNYFWAIPSQVPSEMLFGNSIFKFGIWEFSSLISKLCVPALLFFLFSQLRRKDRKIGVVFITFLLIGVALFLAAGFPVNQHLPLVRHYHNPVKILASFIPLIFIATSIVMNDLFLKAKRRELIPKCHCEQSEAISWLDLIRRDCFALLAMTRGSVRENLSSVLFVILTAFVTIEGLSYFPICSKNPDSILTSYDSGPYKSLKKARRLPAVTEISSAVSMDLPFLFRGVSSIRSYEPLFGYFFESVGSQLTEGPTSLVRNGAFNINHPGCFLYPEALGCGPWARLPANQPIFFNRFIRGDSLPEWVPLWHKLHIWMNAFCILGALIFLSVTKAGLRLQARSLRPLRLRTLLRRLGPSRP